MRVRTKEDEKTRHLRKWGLRFCVAPLLVVSLLILAGGLGGQAEAKPERTPTPKPPVHGEITFELPTVTAENPSASLTLQTPVGPVTLSAEMSDSDAEAGQGPALTDSGAQAAQALAATTYQRTCSSWYTIPATAAFGITNSFNYNYSSVTWIGALRYNEWYVPPGHVDDEQLWTMWWPGITYAYAFGQANYVQGWGPFEIILGHFQVSIREDAWGGCKAYGSYGW